MSLEGRTGMSRNAIALLVVAAAITASWAGDAAAQVINFNRSMSPAQIQFTRLRNGGVRVSVNARVDLTSMDAGPTFNLATRTRLTVDDVVIGQQDNPMSAHLPASFGKVLAAPLCASPGGTGCQDSGCSLNSSSNPIWQYLCDATPCGCVARTVDVYDTFSMPPGAIVRAELVATGGALTDVNTGDDEASVVYASVSGVPSLSIVGLCLPATILTVTGAILHRRRVRATM
jgi:hypothetical protein